MAELILVEKIWDHAPHSAFTDLIRFKDQWYLTFREGADHVGGDNGTVRILASVDGKEWESVTTFEREGVDLRDPKFSITPENKLMIIMAGSIYSDEWEYVSRTNFVTTSTDGSTWAPFQEVLREHDWLWRVTWNGDKAYGVSYRSENFADEETDWVATLYSSDDGFDFQPIKQWEIPGRPSETTLRFTEDGKMIALVRNRLKAWIGESGAPYQSWKWQKVDEHVGGPNFLILPDGQMWAACRFIDWEKSKDEDYVCYTALAKMTKTSLEPHILLPGGGDTGYPGMIYHEGALWVSYYSSHEEKAAIYLAKFVV